AGPYASFLGSSFNPTWTEYVGEATRSVVKTLRDMKIDCFDPYVACNADSHFQLSATRPLPDLNLDRLQRRRTLLEQFDDRRREFDSTPQSQSLSRYQELAFSLITSPQVAAALDIRKEPQATRNLYGMTLF